MAHSDPTSLSNLVATIEAVAAGNLLEDHHEVLEGDILENTVLQLENGQSINVVQVTTDSLADAINVVHVEAEDIGELDEVSMDQICEIDIDVEEQQHILSETGAHVVVNTEDEIIPSTSDEIQRNHDEPRSKKPQKSPVVLPSVPFGFPGQAFDTKCQKLILNVWDFFRRVKKNPDLLDEIKTPQERAAAALHISAATIGKIGKSFKQTGKLEGPGKRKKRTKPVLDCVGMEQEKIIRNVIKELKDNRITPTLPVLLNACRERINFQGGATSFRRILQRMGFKTLASRINMNHGTKPRPSSSLHYFSEPEPMLEENPVTSFPPSDEPLKAHKGRILNSATGIPVKKDTGHDGNTSKLISNISSLLGGNIIQLTSAKGETFELAQQATSALTLTKGSETQTIHLLRPDNTIQQVQVIYANITD